MWYDPKYKPDLVEEEKPEAVPAAEVILKTGEVFAPLGDDGLEYVLIFS